MKMNNLELLKQRKKWTKKIREGQKNDPSVVSGVGTKWLMFWQLVFVNSKCG